MEPIRESAELDWGGEHMKPNDHQQKLAKASPHYRRQWKQRTRGYQDGLDGLPITSFQGRGDERASYELGWRIGCDERRSKEAK